jgi:Cysteine-rich CPCC
VGDHVTRREAVDLLARYGLARLSRKDRVALLLDWWSIEAEDPDYSELPTLLKGAIALQAGPDDPMKSTYDPLLLIALRRSFIGVSNAYLTRRVARLGHRDQVEGSVEKLEGCPCCGYRTLRERGLYEICCVCFWEDDGTSDTTHVSAANGMTLREARANIATFGAVSESARHHVVTDGRERFLRDDSCVDAG